MSEDDDLFTLVFPVEYEFTGKLPRWSSNTEHEITLTHTRSSESEDDAGR